MRTALYFPHTEIRSQNLLKTSLLLWDKLEFIVPFPDYKPHYQNPSVAKAIELIGVQHCPSETEKQETHDLIEDFATGTLPDVFYYLPTQDNYEIYPQKFLPIPGTSTGEPAPPRSRRSGRHLMDKQSPVELGGARLRSVPLLAQVPNPDAELVRQRFEILNTLAKQSHLRRLRGAALLRL
jgi:hypothetical protein